MWISIPIPAIEDLNYTILPKGTLLSAEQHGLESREGFFMEDSTPRRLAMLNIVSNAVLISGGNIPTLLTKELNTKVSKLIADAREKGTEFKIVIRHAKLFTSE